MDSSNDRLDPSDHPRRNESLIPQRRMGAARVSLVRQTTLLAPVADSDVAAETGRKRLNGRHPHRRPNRLPLLALLYPGQPDHADSVLHGATQLQCDGFHHA